MPFSSGHNPVELFKEYWWVLALGISSALLTYAKYIHRYKKRFKIVDVLVHAYEGAFMAVIVFSFLKHLGLDANVSIGLIAAAGGAGGQITEILREKLIKMFKEDNKND